MQRTSQQCKKQQQHSTTLTTANDSLNIGNHNHCFKDIDMARPAILLIVIIQNAILLIDIMLNAIMQTFLSLYQ